MIEKTNHEYKKMEEENIVKAPSYIQTAEQLLNLKICEIPFLLKDVFPKTGVCALAGSSDCGKSTILRQLATSIVRGQSDFLGMQLNASFKSAIYVSTEDDENAISFLLQKQNPALKHTEELAGLRYIFDSGNLLTKLHRELDRMPADLVVIDTFTDIYPGEMNSANKVRSFLEEYSRLARKYKGLIIFLHHTGKKTEFFVPSKNNLLGSQGFESKMRSVIELRREPAQNELRHLCIVKGNYIKDADKDKSFVLKMDENMIFSNTGARVPFAQLVKPSEIAELKKEEQSKAKSRVMELVGQKLSYRTISDKLKEEGMDYGKSAIAKWAKVCPSTEIPKEKPDSGQQDIEFDEEKENEVND